MRDHHFLRILVVLKRQGSLILLLIFVDPTNNLHVSVQTNHVLRYPKIAIFLQQATKDSDSLAEKLKDISYQNYFGQVLSEIEIILLDQDEKLALLVIQDDDFGRFWDAID